MSADNFNINTSEMPVFVEEWSSRLLQCGNAEVSYALLEGISLLLLPECRGCLYTRADGNLRQLYCWGEAFPEEKRVAAAVAALKAEAPEEVPFREADLLILPFYFLGEITAVFAVSFPEGNPGKGPRAEDMLTVAARMYFPVWYALTLHRELEKESVTDRLTGLYNRSHMEAALERIANMARRQNISVGIVMLDVDRFRPFVDKNGRAGGDAVLKGVANQIKSAVRVEDIASRYGYDKYAIILPGIDPKSALNRAELLLEKIRSLEEGVTASAGIKIFFREDSWREALRIADEALRLAKDRGRDRVVAAD